MSKKTSQFWGLRSFLRFMSRHKLGIVIVGISFVIASGLLAVIPLAIGALVQALNNHQDPWLYVWILVFCSSFHDIMWHVAELTYAKFILPLSFDYETLLFKNVARRPYHYFVDKFTGKVSSYITGISQEFRSFSSDLFFNYVSQLVNVIAVILILGSINWQTGAIYVIGFILMFIIGHFTLRKSTETERIETDVISTKNGYIIDAVANFPSIKSFQTEIREIKNIAKQQSLSFKASRRAYLWGVVFWASMSLVVRHLIWPATIILNVYFYTQGITTIGQLTTLLTTALLFSNTVWEIVWHVSQFRLKFARVEESHTYLFGPVLTEDIYIDTSDISPLKFGDTLVIDNLNFAYPDKPNKLILKDFHLSIKKGEKIGIVGKSGSGKSTLTKILLGYYAELGDTIKIDGTPTDIMTVAHGVSFVPQDTSLFHRSIADNIAYASPDLKVNREAVIDAAKKAQAHEFIKELDGKYDALVGERGVKLSGGQRQRIAIARAILKDAPILLLDEATSALDSESEQLIQEALEKLMKIRTSSVIAHRLSTIAKLDRIIVLDQGNIIEEGSHTELLEKKGTYAKLWAHQSGGFIEE